MKKRDARRERKKKRIKRIKKGTFIKINESSVVFTRDNRKKTL
jgi:hypothetical protein